MSGDILIFLKIPRSANNPGLKAKSEKNNQLILKSSTVFKSECICCFSKIDNTV